MKRALKALITILCALALACSGTAVFAQSGADEAGGYTDAVSAFADAEQSARAEKTETWELFLPSSSEQFLPLTSPTDYAINENYIAISQGSTIYPYDKTAADGYKAFTDDYEIGSLNFYEYDGGTYLYYVSRQSGSLNQIRYIRCDTEEFATQSPTDTGSGTCYRFVIGNGYVCFVDASKYVYLTTITGLTISSDNTQIVFGGSDIYFAVSENGTIYFSAGRAIKTVQPETHSSADWRSTTESVGSFAVLNDQCYYNTAETTGNTLRLCDDSGDRALTDGGSAITNISAVHCYNGSLYLISGSSVRAFTESGFTDFQITQYSDQVNRLGEGASSLSVYEDTLFIADTRNSRVLSCRNGVYTAVAELSSPELVCAGENSFAVYGNSSTFLIYERNDGTGEYSAALTQQISGLIGIAHAFGSYYALANNGVTYVFTPSESSSYSMQTGSITLSGGAPRSLAAGIDGTVYVLSGDNNVYRYSEDEFLSSTSTHTSVATFDNTVTDILVDYEGTVYGLTEGSVLVGGAANETQLELSSFVSFADNAKAVSFAFGFEKGDAYILTDAGFVVQWSGGIESLNNIAAGGAYAAMTQNTLTDAPPNDLLVTVPEGAIAVELNETAFAAGMQTLPVNGYERISAPCIGVQAATITDPNSQKTIGTLVALYEYVTKIPAEKDENGKVISPLIPEQHNYNLYLVLENSAQPLSKDAYFTKGSGTYYTSNAVGLYSLPLLRTGNATYRQELAKNTRVTVLGYVGTVAGSGVSITVDPAALTNAAHGSSHYGLDADYCFVSYSADGQTVYGFVPASYLNASPSSGITGSGSAEITYRHIAEGESVTLYDDAENARVFENEELLTVYGEADENGLVFVRYTADGISYSGWIEEALLAEASDFGIWVLVAVTIVTAAVLASACYLVLRKPPVMEAPLPAEEDADGDGSPESGTDLPDETDGNTPPQDGRQSDR